MKTIEVTDKMYEKLIELSKEINNQDNRATRMPYFFQIQTDEKRIVSEGTEFWYKDDEELETENEINKELLESKTMLEIEKMSCFEKEQKLKELGWQKKQLLL